MIKSALKAPYENTFKCEDFKKEQNFTFKMNVPQSLKPIIELHVFFFEYKFMITLDVDVLFVGPKKVTVDNIEKCYYNILSVTSDKLFSRLLEREYIVRR